MATSNRLNSYNGCLIQNLMNFCRAAGDVDISYAWNRARKWRFWTKRSISSEFGIEDVNSLGDADYGSTMLSSLRNRSRLRAQRRPPMNHVRRASGISRRLIRPSPSGAPPAPSPARCTTSTPAARPLLLDCGLFQGQRAESRRRNRAVSLSAPRTSTPSCSATPTSTTAATCPTSSARASPGRSTARRPPAPSPRVMLGDAAKIQEEDAAYLNRKRDKGEPKIEPLYDGRDVYRTLLRLQAVPYDTPVDVGAGAGGDLRRRRPPARLGDDQPAGSTDRSGERRLTFTGDLGRPGLPILRDPAPVPPGDLLISESTYGGHTHEPVEETAERLGEVVRRTAERGGKLIIPAFSVGRTQTIVYFLHQLMNAGRLPDLPIYVDSPMAVRATEVFRAHPECFDEETLRAAGGAPRPVRRAAHPLRREGPREHRAERPARSRASSSRPAACARPGRILHHLKHNIEDPRNTILIVGYQAPDTLGRRLVDGQPEVRILGRTCKLKAEVVVLNGLSSHADHGGLLRELRARCPDRAKGAAGPRRARAGRGTGRGTENHRVQRRDDA